MDRMMLDKTLAALMKHPRQRKQFSFLSTSPEISSSSVSDDFYVQEDKTGRTDEQPAALTARTTSSGSRGYYDVAAQEEK